MVFWDMGQTVQDQFKVASLRVLDLGLSFQPPDPKALNPCAS